uniref:TM2 domain-containing protein n=1 Tax=Glossina austeni TaxID=7395 RepID=A0A1A9UEL1_GLOAU
MQRCVVINRRSALTLVWIFVLSGIRQSQTDEVETKASTNDNGNSNEVAPYILRNFNETTQHVSLCQNSANTSCNELHFPCIRCLYNYTCHYGQDVYVNCSALYHVECLGSRWFWHQMNCRYCYQTEKWQQKCVLKGSCNSVNGQYYKTNCTVNSDVFCLGNRSFSRNIKCNWTQGYRWSTAVIISLTLGGFGADRFYLGHWQEGIGKLFSFGGLGVWTIIDVVLISLHYLGPADGSLYI